MRNALSFSFTLPQKAIYLNDIVKSEATMEIITIIIRGQQHIWRAKLESFPNQLSSKCWHQFKISDYIRSTSSHLGKHIVGRIHLGQTCVAAASEKRRYHLPHNLSLSKPSKHQGSTAKSSFQRADTVHKHHARTSETRASVPKNTSVTSARGAVGPPTQTPTV